MNLKFNCGSVSRDGKEALINVTSKDAKISNVRIAIGTAAIMGGIIVLINGAFKAGASAYAIAEDRALEEIGAIVHD